MSVVRSWLFAQQSPRSQSIVLMGARIVQASFAMLTPIVLVRFLDQTDYGYYRKLVLVLFTFQAILSLGLPQSIFYHVSRSRSSCHRLVVRSLVVLSGLGLVSGAIVFFSADRLEQTFDVPLTPYLPWIFAYVAMSLPATLTYLLPAIDQRTHLQALLLIVIEVLRTGLVAIAVIATGSIDVLVVVLCVYVVAKLLALLLYLLARRQEESGADESPSFGGQLRYAIPVWSAALITITRNRAHMFFVAGMFDSVEFAIFAVGTLAIPAIPFLNEAIGNVMLIQTARSFHEDRLAAMRRVWFRAVQSLALTLIPAFVVLEVFADDLIVTAFGIDYVDSVPIFRIYLIALLSWVPALCSPLLRATGDTRPHLFAELAALMGAVGTLLLAARYQSLYLSALAPAVGFFVFSIAASPLVGKRMGLGPLQIYPFRAIAKIASGAAVTCSLSWILLLPFDAAVRLFVGGPLAGVLFATVAWRFGLIEDSEKDLGRASLRRVLPARCANALIHILGG